MLAPRNTIIRRFEASTSSFVQMARGSNHKSPGKVFFSPRKVFGKKNHLPI